MLWKTNKQKFILLLFSNLVMSDSLRPHGPQHARLLSLPLSPGICSNSCPLSQCCYLTTSPSADPFSLRLQLFPGSGSFSVSQPFTSSGQNIGASASASVLPTNIHCGFPLELTVRLAYCNICFIVAIWKRTFSVSEVVCIVKPILYWWRNRLRAWDLASESQQSCIFHVMLVSGGLKELSSQTGSSQYLVNYLFLPRKQMDASLGERNSHPIAALWPPLGLQVCTRAARSAFGRTNRTQMLRGYKCESVETSKAGWLGCSLGSLAQ